MREQSLWSRLKQTWHDMIRRCTDCNDKSYKTYGGRGISVCERWIDNTRKNRRCSTQGFLNFFEDMGPSWFIVACIDRIDNNGDYTVENCRWLTRSENTKKSNLEREVSGMKGKSHSLETRKKQSDARKQYWTDEKRVIMSERLLGVNNPRYKHGRYMNAQ